jgi:hypothetical protein
MNATNRKTGVSLTIAGVLVIALAGCSSIQPGASTTPEGIGDSPDNPYISGE